MSDAQHYVGQLHGFRTARISMLATPITLDPTLFVRSQELEDQFTEKAREEKRFNRTRRLHVRSMKRGYLDRHAHN